MKNMGNRFMGWRVTLGISLLFSLLLLSCSKNELHLIFEGKLNAQYIAGISGFVENRATFLQRHNMSNMEFIALSTVLAANLSEADKAKLKAFRNDLPIPNQHTLFQKTIPLSETTIYMENTYGGSIGGFFGVAADIKQLRSMKEVFWGLRLDYPDTKFKEDGAGYAIIRFYPVQTDSIVIPYSPEMGRKTIGKWPFSGGGFTTSTLGEGGFPEYKYNGYYLPAEGAELYECTPSGREILRSVFQSGKWVTAEGTVVKVKSFEPSFVPQYVTYKGHSLFLRGETEEGVHLFSSDPTVAAELGMEVYEKGEYRLIVPANEMNIDR